MTVDRWPSDPDGDVTGIEPASGRDLALVDELDGEDWVKIEEAARTRRVPFVMGGVTAAAGATAWSCAQIAASFGGADAAATAAAVTVAGTAVAVPVLRSVFRHRIPDAWRRRWWLSTSCAAAWVDVLAVQGPGLLTVDTAVGVVSTLLLGGVVLGARWADEHEVPNPGDVEPEPEAPPVPLVAAPRRPQIDTSRAAEIERDWAAEVAGGRNPIAPGSVLQQRTHLPHGYRWIVQLDRGGSVGCTDLETEGMAARVALKLGIRATHVMLERLEGDDDREDQAQLTVVTRDVLAAGVPYEGPNYTDGVIRIGRYADGTGAARWTAYDATGVQCGLVTGEQRSGKSAFMAKLGGDYKSSGEWTVLFGDGDRAGGSSPLLSDIADDFARGPQEVLEQLEGLEAIQREVRGDLMGTLTLGPDGKPVLMTRPGQVAADKMLPCPDYPGLVWILDEFHLLTGDPDLQAVNFTTRVGKVVRGLAKYGVSLIIGTQSQLGDDFDGDSALRAMLAKNQVTLRSKNKSEYGVVGDGQFNPGSLPKGGGYAFLGDGVRQAMIRIEFSKDMHRWVPEIQRLGVTPDELTWAVFRRYRTVRVLDRVADLAERTARLAAVRAALDTDAPLPGSPEARAADGEDGDVDAAPMSIGGFDVPGAVGGNVVPIRPETVAEPRADPATSRRVSDKALRVLAMLRTHPDPWTTAQLERATGLAKPDVSKALRELVKAGLAYRPTGKQGVYAAGPAQDSGTPR